MAKQQLTKRQQNAKRLQAQQAEAATRRLMKELSAPVRNSEIRPLGKVRDLPSLSYDQSRSTQQYPSALTMPVKAAKAGPVVDPRNLDEQEQAEWLAREQAAQAEIDVKKTRVAPMFNKGGYQYIGDEVDPATIGSRKI
jgi:hypothetical protein